MASYLARFGALMVRAAVHLLLRLVASAALSRVAPAVQQREARAELQHLHGPVRCSPGPYLATRVVSCICASTVVQSCPSPMLYFFDVLMCQQV
jgi:hypothetical protein